MLIRINKEFLINLIFLSLVSFGLNHIQGQTTVFSDDFSASANAAWTTSGVIGSSSWSVTRSGDDWGARRNASPEQLEQTNDASGTANLLGWVFSSVPLSSFSSPFITTLNSNPGLITWTFNFRTNRASALAGFTATNSYGMALILACTSNSPNTSGCGYAVVMGGGGNNTIALICFNNGLQGTRTTMIGFGNAPTSLNDYLSVKATYNPTGNNWELYSRDDGSTGFADPASGTLLQIGTTTSNSTYTGTSMSYFGAYWQGSTIANQTCYFDNIKVTVLPSTTPLIAVGSITGFGNQVVNTTSAEKSYTVSGEDLSNNIVITPPANFEISLTSGSGFVANPASISLAPSGGIVSPTSIYVRFKPTAVTDYSGNITHTSTGAVSQNVAVIGTGTSPADPTSVSATAISNSEIDIAFIKNGTNNVMIAWNTSATFGTPSGGYTAGNSISGGGSVLYVGGNSPYLHQSLTTNTGYYYKIWTVDPLNFYSPGVEVNTSTLPAKPSNHPTGFSASSPSPSINTIDFSWKDAGGTTIPDGYLIKASAASYGSIVAPVDGTPETDGILTKIVGPVVEIANFTGLTGGTTYYFKVWPYTNSGTSINYKTDGTPPQAAVTTKSSHIFFSEYLEGLSNNKALEVYNGETVAIDLTKLTVNTYANGAGLPSYTWTGSGGTLAAGSTYVISNSLANATIQALSNTNSQVCWFNGNDAIELVYDGQEVDKIGLIGGVPPATGYGWSVAGIANATMDKTLVRKLNITSGTSDWSSSAGTDTGNSQWVVLGTDYTGNLGGFGTAWTGTSGTSWADGTNWDLGVPSATVNCIISPSANNPEITGPAQVKNLFIKPSAVFIINGSVTYGDGLITITP